MTPQQDLLRTTLRRLGDSPEPLPLADDLWQRGQAARRRGQVLVVVAVLAVLASLGGVVTLVSTDREARTATAPSVPGGAIPSRIEDPGQLAAEEDLAIGRASVAFLSAADQAVVVGATDGSYHALALDDAPEDGGLLALSPDGRHLAWSNHGRIHSVDLEEGQQSYYGSGDEHASVTTLAWAPGSHQLLWTGADTTGGRHGGVLPAGDSEGGPLFPAALRGIPSPTGDLVALTSTGSRADAPFSRRQGKAIGRGLPADLYPDGATVRPLGWTQPHLVLADVDGPAGSYVEGHHLALFTSPDRPESEWTYRIVMRGVPDVASLSLAVDLVPDLDGTSSQQLTHDFDADSPSARRDISWLIGLGVAAAIAVLMALRWLWRRLLPWTRRHW
jgi:hypothetical protein